MLFASTLTSHADTTTDNLLNNPNFTTDTSGWELSDNNQNKVKRDPATYSGSASKSVRFRYQGGNISQDVDISGVSENHLIKEINMNFDSIGCGNTGTQWCYAGADDTVVSTITLSTESTVEVLAETVAVPYEDGWESYSFTKDVVGDFNTDDTSINLTITGNDTGNSSNWYGPIIDNLSLTLTTEQYVAPIVEPVIEPITQSVVVVEEIVEQEITNTIVGGLDLDVSVTNEIILEQPILEVTPINVNITTEPLTIDMPEQIEPTIEINIAPVVTIDMPDIDNLAPLNEVEEIQEIVEIELPEIVEVDVEEIVEEPAEINNEDTHDEDMAEVNQEELEELEESLDESETTKTDVAENETSELSESTEKTAVKKSVKKTKDKKKKTDKKETVVSKKTNVKTTDVGKKSKEKTKTDVLSVESLVQMTLPDAYLQTLQDTLKIVETVSITQDMIYEQNTYDLIGITFESSFGGDSADRFDSLLGRQFSYESGTYRRSR